MSAQLPAIKTAAPGLRAVRGRRLAWAKLWPESGAVNPIPALDGLRALAVLLVILFHASTFAEGNPSGNPASAIFYGKTGVQLFYVLSGFLLSLPYAQWFFGLRKRPSTLLFYKRRALRVGPAYWVSLLILGLATAPTIASVRDVALHAVFLSNTTWLSTFSINGVYWTMAIEVQFYALLPLIWLAIYGLARLVRPAGALVVILAALVLISLASHIIGASGRFATVPVVASAILSYAAMPYWLGVFACGIGAAAAYTFLTRVSRIPAQLQARLRTFSTVACLAGIAFGLMLAFSPDAHHWLVQDLLFGLAYTGLLAGVLLGAPIFRRLFASRPARLLGLISYSFYIWHRVVLHVLASKFGFIHSLPGRVVALFIVGTLLSAAVAYASYQLLERPFLTARKRAHESESVPRRGRRPAALGVSSSPRPTSSGAPGPAGVVAVGNPSAWDPTTR